MTFKAASSIVTWSWSKHMPTGECMEQLWEWAPHFLVCSVVWAWGVAPTPSLRSLWDLSAGCLHRSPLVSPFCTGFPALLVSLTAPLPLPACPESCRIYHLTLTPLSRDLGDAAQDRVAAWKLWFAFKALESPIFPLGRLWGLIPQCLFIRGVAVVPVKAEVPGDTWET